MLETLLRALSGPGAVFMYAITALLAFALAVGIERLIMLIRWRVDPGPVNQALADDDAEAAVRAGGDTPLGRVLREGAAQSGPDAAWDAMGAAAAEAESQLRARVGYLGAVANIATMLGLLGTVYGLILAFSALGDASAGERAVKLSEGISTAMSTTAFGLMVGIPALALHAWLDGLATRRMAEIEAAAGRMVLLIRRRTSAG